MSSRSIIAAAAFVTTALAGGAQLTGQNPPTEWQFETVAKAVPGCAEGMTLVGFDHDADGRPVLAWQEGCVPRVFWTRPDAGTWPRHEFISDRRWQGGGDADTAHRLIVLPGDGTPVLVYAAPGPYNELNTYSVNLQSTIEGSWASVYLENLVPPQGCVYPSYALAAEPGAVAGSGGRWATAQHSCNDLGSVRVNGVTITTALVAKPRVALALTPDGGQHLLWSTETQLFYTRRAPRATEYVTRPLTANLERFGGEVRLVADASGVLHALVRGYAPDSSFDSGALVYFQSADGGETWTPPEYVDPWDAVAANNGVHTDISLAVDAAGVPAVTYWKSRQQLWYAKRNEAGNAWSRARVATRPNVDAPRAAQVDFDTDGQPVIAYYDQPTNRIFLARPIPEGMVIPVDLSLAGRVSPASVQAGDSVTYTFTVTNQGTTNVTGATLTPRPPPGVTVLSASPALGPNGDWTLPTLAPFTSTTATLTVSAPFAEGDFVTTAAVSTRAVDNDPTDDRVALGASVRASQCFVPTTGLAGLWRGDGTTANAVAGQAGGTAVGVLAYTPGVVGDGFLLNGTDAAVTVEPAIDDAFYPGDGSFSVQAWVRTTSSLVSVIASRYECVYYSCGQTAWFFQLSNGVPLVYLRNNAGASQTLAATRAVHDGAFHHLAFVIDRTAGELRLYVDGVVDATTPYTLGTISNSNYYVTPLTIGAAETYNATRTNFFTGVIDELAIARRVLTDTELAAVAAIPEQAACGVSPLVPAVDVAAAVSATPAETTSLGTLTYQLRATNLGMTTATDVALTQVLPLGAMLVDATPSAGITGNTLSFPVGTLAPGASAWAVVHVTAPTLPGPAVSTVRVAAVGDVNAANDAATATVQIARATCELVPQGLVAHWRANGTGADSAGTATGLLRGRVDFIPSRAGSGLAFGLTGEGFIEVPAVPVLRPARFTLAAWVAPEFTMPGDAHAALSDGDTYWLGSVDGGPAVFLLRQGGTTISLEGPTALDDDWHHLAVTYDGSTLRLYVDGVEVDARALTAPPAYADGNAPFLIGDASSLWGANPYHGRIDDVTLHGRALSAAEVVALAGNLPAACVANTPPVLTRPADQVNTEGDAIAMGLAASDADADALTFAATGLPSGLALDAVTGAITGTPALAGSFPVIVRVTDGIDVAEAAFRWDVHPLVAADVQVSLSPVQQDAESGLPFVTITVANAGPSMANDLAIYLIGAGNLTFLSASYVTAPSGGGCFVENWVVTCGPITLDAGAQVQIRALFSPLTDGDRHASVTASAVASESDPDQTNNTRTLSLDVPRYVADLGFTLAAVPSAYAPGGTVSFTMTVRNDGPERSLRTGVRASLDGMPAPGSTRPDGCGPTGTAAGYQEWRCTLPSLAPGEAWSASFNQTNTEAGTRTSTATLDDDVLRLFLQEDPVPGNDIGTVTTTAACDVLPGGLVGRWRADGTAVNAVTGVIGRLVGPVGFTAGRVGRGLAFTLNGAGHVEVADEASLRPSAFTIGAWAAPEFPVPGGVHALLSQGGAYWLGFTDGGRLVFGARQSTGVVSLEGRTTVSSDDHHVAVTYDGTTVRLFLDGEEQDSRVLAEPLVLEFGAPLIMGAAVSAWSPSAYYGQIDNVTLHNRALAPIEIEQLSGAVPAACLANAPPTLSAIGDQLSNTNEAVALQLVASDADRDPLTFAVSGLPAGLTLDPATGLISGTAATSGAFAVTARVTDGIDVDEAAFTWRTNFPPTVSDPGVPVSAEGDLVSLAIVATDQDGDTVRFAATGLPQGLAIDAASGVVAGTLSFASAGHHLVRITVTDGLASSSREFAWEVAEVNDLPRTNVPEELVSHEGEFIARGLLASDPDGDTVTLTVLGLPTWLTVNRVASYEVVVSGTPPFGSAGAYPYTVTASDGLGTLTLARSWRVQRGNRPPMAVADLALSGISGVDIDVLANDVDPEGTALSVAGVTQPSHGTVVVTPSLNRLTYRPDGVPPFDDAFTYTVRDADGGSATGTVTVRVLGNGQDVSVAVIAEPPSVLTGQLVQYRIRVRNLSIQASPAATLTASLPAALAFADADPPPSSVMGLTATWQLGALAPGAMVEIVVRLSNPLSLIGAFDLRAFIPAAQELNQLNNTAVATAHVSADVCFVPAFALTGRLPFDRPDVTRDAASSARAWGVVTAEGSYRGEGARFNGVSDVSWANVDGRLSPAAFTVAAWVKPDALRATGFDPVLSQRRNLDNGYSYWLGFDNGRPTLVTGHGRNISISTVGAATVEPGIWHHLVGTFDGTTARVYLDGLLAAETVIDAPVTYNDFVGSVGNPAGGEVRIGSGPRLGVPTLFVGEMDEVTVHARALDAAEILAMVHGPVGTCGPAATRDLSVTATAIPSATVVDGAVTYELSVTNASTGYVSDVQLTHELPTGSTYLSATVPAVTTDLSRTYEIGSMTAGQTATIRVRSKAPPFDGRHVSQARVTPSDDNDANDLALAALLVEPAACFVVPNGLLGYWDANGTTRDSAGGVDGVFDHEVGSFGYTADARADRAFVVSANAIRVADGSRYRSPAFTIAAWVNAASWRSGAWSVAVWNGDRVSLGLDDGYPAIRTRHEGVGERITRAPARVTARTWTLVAASFDGAIVRLSVNGALVAESLVDAPLVAAADASPLIFGARLLASGLDFPSAFSGSLDEIAIYDRALSTEEMRTLFDGSPESCVVNERPTLVNPGPQSGVVGATVRLDVRAADPEGQAITVTATGLPQGLTIDPATGVIAGAIAPGGSGPHTVVVTVSDGRFETSESFAWDVLHRLTITVGRGALLRINDAPCDARVAEATCSWDFADGARIAHSSEVPATFAGTRSWWEDAGGPLNLAASFVVDRSRTLRYFRLVEFAVTIEHATFPDVQVDLLHASVPVINGDSFLVRDVVSCYQLPVHMCIGRAPMYSTITLSAQTNGVASTFERFSGDCEGSSCSLTLDRTGLAVTLNYRTRLLPLTVQAGPHAVAVVRNLSDGSVQTCTAGAAAELCAFEVPYGSQIEFTSATPGWTRWFAQRRDPSGNFPTVFDTAISFQATVPEVLRLSLATAVTLNVHDLRFNPLDSSTPVAAECLLPSQGVPPFTQCRALVPAFEWWEFRTLNEFADGVLEGSACGIDGRCRVWPDAPEMTVDVAFRYRLTLHVGPGGRVEAGGAVCEGGAAGATCFVNGRPGEASRLTAVGNDARYLAAWIQPDGGQFFDPVLDTAFDASKAYSVTFVSSFAATRSSSGGIITAQLPQVPYAVFTGPTDDVWTGAAPVGSSVVLSAQADPGEVFVGWSGDCAGAGDCTLVLTRGGMNVSARFNRPPLTLPDLRLTTPADVPLAITIPGTDPDGDTLTAELLFGGVVEEAGHLERTGPLSFRFTPSPSFLGQALFFYRLTDGVVAAGTSGVYIQVTAATTVRIVVDEAIAVSDAAEARGPVSIIVDEAISLVDAPVAMGPVSIVVDESITVADAPVAMGPVTIVVDESIRADDGPDLTTQSPRNTPTGSSVTVAAAGPASVSSPPVLTFAGVSQAGQTTFEIADRLASPDGFRFGNPPVMFDIQTTASYTAPVRVCLVFPAAAFRNPAAVRLFHYEGGRWVDRTVSVDVVTRVVCASVTSLSPFALAEPDGVRARMQGEGRVLVNDAPVRFTVWADTRKAGHAYGELSVTRTDRDKARRRGGPDVFKSSGTPVVTIWDDPAVVDGHAADPTADTVVMFGEGKWNGVRGYRFEARAVDRGEPGKGRDTFAVTVWDPAGTVVLQADGVLKAGNVQSIRQEREK